MRSEYWNHIARACIVLLGIAVAGTAQQSGSGLTALQVRLMSGDRTCVVKVDGIHTFTAGPVRPMDNRIVNGHVQARHLLDALHAPNDTLLPVGTVVRVLKVETMQMAVGDVLRITAIAGNGAQAPIAFLMPKGALAGLSGEQLESLVTAVLQPTGGTTAPQQRLAASPQLPVWRIRQVAHDSQKGMKALLSGSAEAGRRKQPALLASSCTKGISPEAYPHALASAAVRVHPEMVNFNTGYMEENLRQLGQSAEIHIDVDASTTDKSVRVLGLGYEAPDLSKRSERNTGKETVPIPADANYCGVAQDSAENRNHAECSRPE